MEQNQIIHTWSIDFKQKWKAIQWTKESFLKTVVEAVGLCKIGHARKTPTTFDLCLEPYSKNNSKWILHLNGKPKIIRE